MNEGSSLRPKLIAMDCIGAIVALSIATIVGAVSLAILNGNSQGLFVTVFVAFFVILLMAALEKIMVARELSRIAHAK